MTQASSFPDATGIPDEHEEVAVEVPVERIEHLGDVLKRLCQGAGKEGLDTLVIEETRGLSSDGVVVTEIQYPFGFKARLGASTVKNCLNHIVEPELKVTPKNIVLKESGKRFQLFKLVRDCFINEYPKPTNTVRIMGEWMARLLPILPSRSGHLLFSGVYVCEKGYIGGDGALLCWIEAPGLKEGAIVPKQLIARIPSGEVDFQIDTEQGTAWVVDQDTVWASPLLHGSYPDWEKAFFETDREIVVERKALIASLRAVLSVEQFTHLIIQQEKERLVCLSVRMADARTSGTQGSRAQAVVPLVSTEGEDFTVTVDARRLLSILDKMKGDTLWIASSERQDRVWIKTLDMKPVMHVIQAGIAGYGANPDEIE